MSLVALLTDTEQTGFAFARDALQVTDPEPSRQASLLEKAGYVNIRKGHVGKRPCTWLSATPAGRAALAHHLRALQRIAATATAHDQTR